MKNHMPYLALLFVLLLSLTACKQSSTLVSSSEVIATASPGGGRYTSVQQISIDAGKTKGTKVYYTLDGSEPFENPNAILYQGPINIGDPEVNQYVELNFYTVDASGTAGENTYTEEYQIIVDEIPPIVKPNILNGVFSRQTNLKLTANEPSTIFYCIEELSYQNECAVTLCDPDTSYTSGAKIPLFNAADLNNNNSANEEDSISKYCLVVQANDRSKNENEKAVYTYYHDSRVPDLRFEGLLENVLEPDSVLDLSFQSKDVKTQTVTSENDLVALRLDSSENGQSASNEPKKKNPYKFLAKITQSEIAEPEVLLGNAVEQMLSETVLDLDLSAFGSALFASIYKLVIFPEQIWKQGGLGINIASGKVDLHFTGADLLGSGSSGSLNFGANNLSVFLIDDSVYPPAVSYLVTRIDQAPSQVEDSLKVGSISGISLTSDDGLYQMVSPTLEDSF